MVPSSTIIVATDGEHLSCDGFCLGETIRLWNFEFITDYFNDLRLSPGEATQALPSWAQLVVGFHPHGGP
jgi:hypothetical protein